VVMGEWQKKARAESEISSFRFVPSPKCFNFHQGDSLLRFFVLKGIYTLRSFMAEKKKETSTTLS
jgi:hypothetical protein